MNLQSIVIALVIGFATGNWSGWEIKGYKTDSENLAVKEAVQKTEKAIAGQLETSFKKLNTNKGVIEREKIKIIDRPVYVNNCLDDDGLQLVNASKSGTAESLDQVH